MNAIKQRLYRATRVMLLGLAMVSQIFLNVRAQNADWVKRKVSDARLSFAVPDGPAFKILDENPSSILRPSSTQELTLLVTDFTRSGGVLPRTFAAEFAPGMVFFGRSLTLEQYQASPILYRAQISAATRRVNDETGRTEASLGVRLIVKDDADPRMDQTFLQSLGGLALRINKAMRGSQESAPTETGIVENQSPDQVATLEKELEQLRSDQKDNHWNASVVELGIATKFVSVDSLAHNLNVDRYAGWFSAAWPVGTSGQFLFGLTGLLARNQNGQVDSSNVSMSARFYFGSNMLKAFSEAQIKAVENEPAYQMLSLGGELNPGKSFWLEFSLGFEKRGKGQAVIASSFNVRWSLPEELNIW